MTVEKKTAEKYIPIDDDGKTLKFRIQKMGATQAEAWLLRCTSAIGQNFQLVDGAEIQTLIVQTLFKVKFAEAKALLDEMLRTCYYVNGKAEIQMEPDDPSTIDGIISNPLTLLRLRVEALKANFGFFTLEKVFASLGKPNFLQTAEKSEE